MLATLHYDKKSFEHLVVSCFGFVESEAKMTFGGVRAIGGTNPQDAALVARYSEADFRFDVGWGEYELSLAVLIHHGRLDVPRTKRYIYFEPFVEYLTNGEDRAIVPYVAENMNIREIEAVMKQRQTVFCNGLPPVMEKVGLKFQHYFDRLKNVFPIQVNGYHQWMRSE